MKPEIVVFSAIVGYLLGSISFARIIGKLKAPGDDLTKSEVEITGTDEKLEFRSVSATTVRIRAGPVWGMLTSILDMVKAALPVLYFRITYPAEFYFLIVSVFAVAGHDFPIYHRFKGGRGYSPLFGGLIVFNWVAIPVTTLLGMLIGLLVNDMFVFIFSPIFLLIPWMWYQFRDIAYVLYAIAINIVFWTSLRPELSEYLRLRRSGALAESKSRRRRAIRERIRVVLGRNKENAEVEELNQNKK